MELIAPNYNRTKVISKDQPFDAFFFMNKNFENQDYTSVKIKTYDNIKQKMNNYEFHISQKNIETITIGSYLLLYIKQIMIQDFMRNFLQFIFSFTSLDCYCFKAYAFYSDLVN